MITSEWRLRLVRYTYPYDEEAKTTMFARMMIDNALKKHLPKFTAGSGFTRAQRRLARQLYAATEGCAQYMVKTSTAHNDVNSDNADAGNLNGKVQSPIAATNSDS